MCTTVAKANALLKHWCHSLKHTIGRVCCTTTLCSATRSLVCVRQHKFNVYVCAGAAVCVRVFVCLYRYCALSQHCAGLQLFNSNKIFKSMLCTESQVLYALFFFSSQKKNQEIACLKCLVFVSIENERFFLSINGTLEFQIKGKFKPNQVHVAS